MIKRNIDKTPLFFKPNKNFHMTAGEGNILIFGFTVEILF